MSLGELKLPDYREQSPAVAARFQRIRYRQVILSVRNLKKCFGSNGNTHVVFDNVSLDIHRREFICVVGASGCGKSTLARIVAGLDEATAGEILLDEKPVNGPGPDRGMVFQGYTLFPWLSVRSNVMFGLKMQGKDENTAKAEARQWLDMVGLAKFENLYPHELSGGMNRSGETPAVPGRLFDFIASLREFDHRQFLRHFRRRMNVFFEPFFQCQKFRREELRIAARAWHRVFDELNHAARIGRHDENAI